MNKNNRLIIAVAILSLLANFYASAMEQIILPNPAQMMVHSTAELEALTQSDYDRQYDQFQEEMAAIRAFVNPRTKRRTAAMKKRLADQKAIEQPAPIVTIVEEKQMANPTNKPTNQVATRRKESHKIISVSPERTALDIQKAMEYCDKQEKKQREHKENLKRLGPIVQEFPSGQKIIFDRAVNNCDAKTVIQLLNKTMLQSYPLVLALKDIYEKKADSMWVSEGTLQNTPYDKVAGTAALLAREGKNIAFMQNYHKEMVAQKERIKSGQSQYIVKRF
jgi:hypothetical protein